MSIKRSLFFLTSVFCLLSFVLIGCAFESDVSFSRRVMTQLIEGRYSARHNLDWPRLKMMLADVGAEYSRFQSDEARLNYQRSFIANFARGFQENKGSKKAFFNWRDEISKDPKFKVVAANCLDKNTTFYFVIGRVAGKRKIIEIQVLHQLQPGEKFQQMPQQASTPTSLTPEEQQEGELQPMGEQR